MCDEGGGWMYGISRVVLYVQYLLYMQVDIFFPSLPSLSSQYYLSIYLVELS